MLREVSTWLDVARQSSPVFAFLCAFSYRLEENPLQSQVGPRHWTIKRCFLVFFATQVVTSERIIGNGVKSPSIARRHIGRQLVAHFACKLMQHSCLALTLIALSGDVELNPGYRSLKNTKEFRRFKIAHLNVRSIRNKTDQIQLELLRGQFFDILTFSESWLNDSIEDAEVQILGFACVRKDREDGAKGGGNIAYIRDGLPFRIRHDLNNDNNECLWFEIVRQKCKPVRLF